MERKKRQDVRNKKVSTHKIKVKRDVRGWVFNERVRLQQE